MKNRQPWSIIKIFACFAIFFLLPISRLEGNQLQSTASTVLALNARLRALYLEVNTLHFSGSPIDKVNQLIAGIEELRAVDAEVALLGPGVTDYLLVDDANRSRAMAWVHAWAIFSRLAASSAMVNVDDTTRTKLIGANDKSALGLLLLTYRQLRVADGTSEPVRHLLSSGAHLSYLLAYKESWPTSPPEGIDHKYFLPSAEDILGSPKDAPELERGLLSLWRLVNLQLDTWQDLDVHYLKEGQTDRPFNDAVKKRAALLIETSTGKRGLVQANRAKTARVATWLQSVLDNPDLRYLDDGPASTGRVGAFKQRVNKLHLFLIFRQNISDEKYLADTLKQLQDLTKESDKDPRKVLRDLVDAATPIGDEKEEVLYEAGIWLRYLLLLSYQGEGQVVVPESQNSLESIWKTYNLPQSLTLTIPAGSTTAAKPEKPAPGPALLRWDSWPTPGSIAYVLNDVSHVTLEFLRFQERMATKEGIRFRSLDSASSRGDYMNALKTEIKAIEDGGLGRLAPYFGCEGGSGSACLATSQDPTAIFSEGGAWVRAFRQTAASAEQERLVHELRLLAREVSNEYQLHQLVATTYSSSAEPESALAMARTLQTFGGLTGLSLSNPYALPRKTFEQYTVELDQAIKRLNKGLNLIEADKELRFVFKERQRSYENAKSELTASHLGRDIAARAIVVQDLFGKVALLDVEIAELGTKIGELEVSGHLSKVEADLKLLAYRTRLRDLAASKVEALMAASQRAIEMVESASRDLAALAPQLKASAANIKSKKDQQNTLNLVNSVITVLGVALAPFTAGSSIAIAAELKQAITTIEAVKNTDWSQLPEAIAAIEKVDALLNQTLKIDMGKFLGGKLQTALGDVSGFLKSSQQSMDSAGQELFKTIKDLKSLDEIQKFASVIASGLPVTFDKNTSTLRIDAAKDSIELKSKAIQSAFNSVLDSGGMFVNDFGTRSEHLSSLISTADLELGAALKQSIDKLIRPLPSQLADAAGLTDTVEQLKKARKQVGDAIGTLDSEGQRVLAQLFASGMVVVRETVSKRIVAIQGAVNGEIEKEREKLKKFAGLIQSDAIKKITKQIEEISLDVNKKVQGFVQTNDDSGLITYSVNGIPAEIERVRRSLAELKQNLEDARNALEDKDTELSIASYDAEASKFFLQSSKLRRDQAEFAATKAGLGSDISRLMSEQKTLELQQQKVLFDASVRTVDMARAALLRSYSACLARGFNPMAIVDGDARVLQPFAGLSVRGLLDGGAKSTIENEEVLQTRVADNIVGLIQWTRMLRLDTNSVASERYLSVAKALRRRSLNDLIANRDELVRHFTDGASARIKGPRIHGTEKLNKKALIWLHEKEPGERSAWLRPLSQEQQRMALAAVRMTFSMDEPQNIDTDHKPANEKSSYYAKLENTYVMRLPAEDPIINTSNLFFVLVAPSVPRSHPEELPSGLSDGDAEYLKEVRPVNNETAEASYLKNIIDELVGGANKLKLSGAIGEWTVYLLTSQAICSSSAKLGCLKNETLDKLRENLTLSIRIPYFEVPPKVH